LNVQDRIPHQPSPLLLLLLDMPHYRYLAIKIPADQLACKVSEYQLVETVYLCYYLGTI